MRLAAAVILIAAACEKEPSPSRADDGSARSAPVLVVTKSEITYDPTRRPRMPPTCSDVLRSLQGAALYEDAALGNIVRLKAPMILGACIDHEWPMALKLCIVTTPTSDLISKHVCDKLVTDELAQKLLDRVAPGQHLSPRDFLQR